MLLVQKQPNLPLAALHTPYNHRRHPSAPPAVVVQPTRTPGLLTISRPQAQRPQPQQRPPRTPASTKTIPTPPAPTVASPTVRGRQVKDKGAANARSESLSARNHVHRQPSPSQAEGLSTPIKSQLPYHPDPFLVSAPSPFIAPRPSGKLATRRRQAQHTNPAFVASQQIQTSHPVSIPQTPKQAPVKLLSRSVPLPRTRTRITNTANNAVLLPPWDFPICDDMTDAGDAPEADFSTHSPPTTPTRPKFHPSMHPLPTSPPFTPSSVRVKRRHGGRNHKRAPSDSGMVFSMSSDESGPEGLNQTDPDEDLKSLIRGMTFTRPLQPRTPARETQGYFASSIFQNSPSPEDLPDPMFI